MANFPSKNLGNNIKVALVGNGRYKEYMASQIKGCQYCEVGLVSDSADKLEFWGKKYLSSKPIQLLEFR